MRKTDIRQNHYSRCTVSQDPAFLVSDLGFTKTKCLTEFDSAASSDQFPRDGRGKIVHIQIYSCHPGVLIYFPVYTPKNCSIYDGGKNPAVNNAEWLEMLLFQLNLNVRCG